MKKQKKNNKNVVAVHKFEINSINNCDRKTFKYILKNIRKSLSKYASVYTIKNYQHHFFKVGIQDLINERFTDVVEQTFDEFKTEIEDNDKVEKAYSNLIDLLDKTGNKSSGSKNVMKVISKGTNGKENDSGVDTLSGLMTRLLKKESKSSPMHTGIVDALITTVNGSITRAAKEGLYHNRVKIPQFGVNMSIPIRAEKPYMEIVKGDTPNNTKVKIKLLNNDYSKRINEGIKEVYNIKGKKKEKVYRADIDNGWVDLNIITKDKLSKDVIDNILSGKWKMGSSQLVDKPNGKQYLYMSYQKPIDDRKLDKDKIMGIDMGVASPVYMGFSFNDKLRYSIDGSEIVQFKKSVMARRRKMLQQGKYCGDGRKGHGRATRIKPIQKLTDKVENFKQTTNHKYSKYVVDMAIKNGCGTIQMEDLSGIADGEKKKTFLGDWTYYDLQQKIEYKAKAKGIDVVKVDPQYTSRRCHKCHHIHTKEYDKKKWRPTQDRFVCQNCNKDGKVYVNADFNAAKNIATKDIAEIIKERIKQQEAYQKHMKKYNLQ